MQESTAASTLQQAAASLLAFVHLRDEQLLAEAWGAARKAATLAGQPLLVATGADPRDGTNRAGDAAALRVGVREALTALDAGDLGEYAKHMHRACLAAPKETLEHLRDACKHVVKWLKDAVGVHGTDDDDGNDDDDDDVWEVSTVSRYSSTTQVIRTAREVIQSLDLHVDDFLPPGLQQMDGPSVFRFALGKAREAQVLIERTVSPIEAGGHRLVEMRRFVQLLNDVQMALNVVCEHSTVDPDWHATQSYAAVDEAAGLGASGGSAADFLLYLLDSYFQGGALCDCRDHMFAAVQRHGWLLKYATPELRSDRHLVLEAVRQDGEALRLASEELLADREFVLEAARIIPIRPCELNGVYITMTSISHALQSDGFFVTEMKSIIEGRYMTCRSQQPEYFCGDWKERRFVLEAVRHDGLRLRHASWELRADRDVVLEAVRQNPRALEFADVCLRRDRGFAFEAIRNGAGVHFLPAFHDDRELVNFSLELNPSAPYSLYYANSLGPMLMLAP